MRLLLISPRVALQKGDFLGSGVPYWPIELAVLAAFLRERSRQVEVIDLFGGAPWRLDDQGDHFLQGDSPLERIREVSLADIDLVVLYAMSYMSHGDLKATMRVLREEGYTNGIAVLENSQAVTAYSLSQVAASLLQAGADGLICGEPYDNWDEIEAFLTRQEGSCPDNLIIEETVKKPVKRHYQKGALYSTPAWDLFPINNYWKLPYAHGPKTKRFLPILTSRGCPYPCDFCVVPETNDRRWRASPAANIVDQIIELRDKFDVRDFQIEDLNPTVNRRRFQEISELLIERNVGVNFYLVSGTKAETIKLDDVPILAKAGCRYISISPESGSTRLMKVIGKPFNHDHGAALIKACRKYGIRTQACFLVGHPHETEEDFRLSERYLGSLVQQGLDEVAVFIVAPFAGSKLYADNVIEVTNEDTFLSFSPKGREGYEDIERRRKQLIRKFFTEKLKKGADLWLQGLRAVFGTPQTKMENLIKRVLYILYLIGRHKVNAVWRKLCGGPTLPINKI